MDAWPDLGIGLGAAAFAGIFTFILCPPVIRWLQRRAVIDVPVARSSHETPTIRGGGVAPAISMSIAGLAACPVAPRLGLAILWIAGSFGLIGTIEDLFGVDSKKRLAAQFLASAIGIVPLFGPAWDDLTVLSAAGALGVAFVWYVAYVNAFNFMDGINGISVAQAAVAGLAFTSIGFLHHEPALVAYGAIVATASIAFLPFNFPTARVFLGDAGSYFLGGWLASLAAVAIVVGVPLMAVVAPLALYLTDTGFTLVRRALRGEPVMEPHREHVYQRLVIQGWSHARATTVVAGLIALCSLAGGIALIDGTWATPAAAAALGLVSLGYLALPPGPAFGGEAERTDLDAADDAPGAAAPLRTLVVTHYFPPEIGAPQARLGDLSRFWADDGDDVTVLTGMPNHPTGVIPPEYRGVKRSIEQMDGHRVVRTWLYATPNEGIVKKTLGHVSFMVSGVLLGGRASRPADVVVVSSPTFFSIFSAWTLAKIKRARLVVEIRDLWPAIFVELGVLTNKQAIWLLERLELWAYRTADAVVVVSEGFRDNLIERGIPAEKVHTIRNGVDLSRFRPGGDPAPGRERIGVDPDTTLVLYIGAHGISHGLESVAEAATLLQDTNVHVAFVGEGAAKPALESRVAELGLKNVSLHSGVARDEVAPLLAAADICLVPLRDVPLFTTFIPSKIFEYFGTGKAVVGAVRGEPAEILADGGAVVVEPEDPSALAAAIRELADDPQRRQEMGDAGRRYVEANFDRRQLATRYRNLLNDVVARKGRARRRKTNQ